MGSLPVLLSSVIYCLNKLRAGAAEQADSTCNMSGSEHLHSVSWLFHT